jgi:hypothetical protein
VVDIDKRHGGAESLRNLEREYGSMPVGPRVRTGGGGEHLFFAHPGQRVKSKVGLRPGVDIRGDGAYVVAAGSLHVSGKRYMWQHGKTPSKLPLPQMPDWVLKLTTQPTVQEHHSSKATGSNPIRDGQRNATLASLAGTMRNRGMSQESITAALLAENRSRCQPPLDDAEVERIAESISRYTPGVEQPTTTPLLKPEEAAYLERWKNNPISGSQAVSLFERFFEEYSILHEGLSFVLALWAIGTRVFDIFDCYPYLGITSPTKRCGKTRVGEILELLCARALLSVNVSDAALFRSIEADQPTVIVDEAESLRNKNSERSQSLLALLQSGHRKGASVIRCVGKNHEVKKFSVFCPKAILAIGTLPDTLLDRSILVPMRRRLQGEDIRRFRRRQVQEATWAFNLLVDGWLHPYRDQIAEAYGKQALDFLHDRDADIWEPLFAIASVAVPGRIVELKRIALQLSGEKSDLDTDNSRGIRLLADIRDIFASTKHAKLETADLIIKLENLPESCWSDFKAVVLARLLRPFGVSPRQVWIDGANRRGYDSADFTEAFAAYLPSPHPLEALEP